LLLAAALFVPAGRLHWPMAWAFLAFYATYSVIGALLVDPELIVERTRTQPDARPLDLLLAGTALVLLLPVTVVVCGFDARFEWSPRIPIAVQAIALGVFAMGYGFALWAARCNRFFSTVVRIQRERGHHVVDTGPYALVRHPGYAGSIPAHLALPIALGSFWGLVPTAAGLVLLAPHRLRGPYARRRAARLSRLHATSRGDSVPTSGDAITRRDGPRNLRSPSSRRAADRASPSAGARAAAPARRGSPVPSGGSP
jgi:protein-S-isoprenylcysteine O-methyltransferase Ste14